MSRINYHHLRYFWAVAHEGNLTRAARGLHVSQSALSVQIQKLEEQLGHPLFERRGRQLILTEAGQIALDHADEIFAVGDELVSTLAEGVGPTRRVLRVGSLATLSRNFQIQYLQPLLRREDVRVVLRSGTLAELLPSLRAHLIDVLLSNTAPPRDATTPWISHLIAEQPVSLVGAGDPRLSGRTLAQLLGEEPLLVPGTESSIRASFDALVDRLGVRPRIAAEVDDMAMLRLLARERVGLAVVPPIVVEGELAAGHLVELARLPGLREAFYATTLKRRFPSPLLRSLPRLDDVEGGER
ncbi:MAG: LysR family transcriptional regulator [Candidatus Krumholzibacteriia bacterium]